MDDEVALLESVDPMCWPRRMSLSMAAASATVTAGYWAFGRLLMVCIRTESASMMLAASRVGRLPPVCGRALPCMG